ncbi:MAG: isochorismatase family protein, partial [Rhodospirillales bacterium]|nr:isochorismatase family protein [Rhodospirillales bacterium]
GYLRERGLKRVFLGGLATDFCVLYSALDACREGFETIVIEDACRAINLDESLDMARRKMVNAGVSIVESTSLIN